MPTFIDTTDVGDSRRPCTLQLQGAAPRGQISEIWRKNEGQGALVFERGKRQRSTFLQSQRAKDPNKIPSGVGPLGDSHEEPDALADALGRTVGGVVDSKVAEKTRSKVTSAFDHFSNKLCPKCFYAAALLSRETTFGFVYAQKQVL